MRRFAVGLLIGSVALGLLPARPALAATITVTTTEDEYGGGPLCSLREAIRAANDDAPFGGCSQGGGPDTIVLKPETYTLTRPGASEDLAATGDLDVRSDVTIVGNGAVIDGNGAATGDRVIEVDPVIGLGSPLLTISNLTIRGGQASAGDHVGGGLLVRHEGRLDASRVAVTANVAFNVGGGIHAEGAASVVLRDSSVFGNTSTGHGGGVGNWEDAVMTIERSTISGNVAENGGGIIQENAASLTIEASTISGNEATIYDGGGILTNNDAGLTIRNATISGNRAARGGGGIYVQDSGSGAAAVVLRHATIAANVADADANGTGDGGGIAIESTFVGTTSMTSSILAGNADASPATKHPDCSVGAAPLGSGGYNVFGSVTGCSITGSNIGNLIDDPQLGPLAANGGPTQTHALLPGSKALDAADPSGAPSSDQRGAPRSVPDIGAYELATCLGLVVNVVGTGGDDVLVGTPAADGVLALAGNDVIETLGGADRVCAGEGDDRVRGGGGKDRVLGEAGNDLLAGQGGGDTLLGGDGRDTLKGGGGNDLLKGQGGNDRINGGPGKKDRCRQGPGKGPIKRCER